MNSIGSMKIVKELQLIFLKKRKLILHKKRKLILQKKRKLILVKKREFRKKNWNYPLHTPNSIHRVLTVLSISYHSKAPSIWKPSQSSETTRLNSTSNSLLKPLILNTRSASTKVSLLCMKPWFSLYWWAQSLWSQTWSLSFIWCLSSSICLLRARPSWLFIWYTSPPSPLPYNTPCLSWTWRTIHPLPHFQKRSQITQLGMMKLSLLSHYSSSMTCSKIWDLHTLWVSHMRNLIFWFFC